MRPRAGARSAPRALPRAVWAITATWTALLLCWTVTLPLYRSPDEVGHVSAALYLQNYSSWPGYQQMPHLTWVIEHRPPGHAEYAPLAAADAPPPGERPSFAETRRDDATERVNTVAQHPPGYYAILAGVSTVLPDGIRSDLEVWFFRLVSVLVMAPLPLLTALAARRLGGDVPATLTAAVLPLGVPQLLATGASVNNDNLLTLSGFAVTAGLAYVLTGDLRRRTAVLLGAALAVGLLTKAWALLFVPMVVIGYAVAGYRTRRWRAALTALVLAGATAALGGWWWLRNLAVHGALQPAGHKPALEEPLGAAEALPGFLREASAIPRRFWTMLSIRFGEGDPPFPLWLTTGLFVALLLAALVPVVRSRTCGMRRADAAVLVAPFFLTGAVLLTSTWQLYLRTGVPAGLQGRYLFVGLAGLLTAAALALTVGLPHRWRWPVPALLGVGALAFTLTAQRRVLAFHWAYRDSSLADGLTALAAWSPVPPALLLALAGAVVAAVVLSAVLMVADLRRPATSLPPR